MEDHSASVIFENCIYCGMCVTACPSKAKHYREDIGIVQHWITNGEKVVACLAPSFLIDFKELTTNQFVKNLYHLGFSHVSETAIGADIVAAESYKWLQNQPDGVYISSCCPAIVNYLHLYKPDALKHLTPLVSPMVAHAQLLRKTLGTDYKIVFIGPCIAKKEEGDNYNQYIDATITFQELQKWFDEEKTLTLNYDEISIPENYILGMAHTGGIFPVDGGMLTTMLEGVSATDTTFMTFSGMETVMDICNELENWKEKGKLYLELMACSGGCIKGPAMINPDGIAAKRKTMILRHNALQKNHQPYKELKPIALDLTNTLSKPFKFKCFFSEEEINEVLESMGKFSISDELNCTGCGYNSCRSLAEAILNGQAQREMCVSCMRKEAQDKASILLQKMPYGFVMVDDNLKILDSNFKFAELFGDEIKLIYESKPGLKGMDLTKLISFHRYFRGLLTSGNNVIEHDVRDGENFFHLSLFTIQKYKSICGIIQNNRDPQVQREIMVKRIQDVIRQNVESVQRIAYLLGENASFTQSMLNSLVESQKES